MRIRTIKPEFFLHERLYSLEESTTLPVRLAYIGLWCIADREGRFKWEPRKIGVQILPYDGSDFAAIMNALASAGFLRRYGSNGEFGVIPSFPRHQCINQREAKSVLPAPASDGESEHVHAHASTCEHHVPAGVNIPASLSAEIMERDGYQCRRCGSTSDLTIDHIFPRSAGGTHAKKNLRTLCRSCNSARPVQGQALYDDLLKDGLTMADMESTCRHVHARGEGKGREQEGKGKEYPQSPHASSDESPSSDGSVGGDGKPRCLPAGWSKMTQKQRGRVRVNFNTPLMERIGEFVGQKPTTLWTVANTVALKEVAPPDDEVDIVEEYYLAELDGTEPDYRRRGLQALLNNWSEEVTRARHWKVKQP